MITLGSHLGQEVDSDRRKNKQWRPHRQLGRNVPAQSKLFKKPGYAREQQPKTPQHTQR